MLWGDYEKTSWSCCVRQTNLPLIPSTSSPCRAMCHGCACSATFTAHVESLFFTVQQLFPVVFMKSHRILKTTRPCLQPSTGVLHRHRRGAEVASSFPCAEVGPSALFFLTGSYTKSLSTKAAVSASALRDDFIIIFLREKGPKG